MTTGKILIVDDQQKNRNLLKDLLEKEYYAVLLATNGQEALDCLEKNSDVSLVLLDIMMPVMDGITACKKIKENPKTSNVPVIMVTALNDIKDRIKGLSTGADDYLTKPVNEIALFAGVGSLLRLKNTFDKMNIQLSKVANVDTLASIKNYISTVANSNILIIDDNIAQTSHMEKVLKNNLFNVHVLNDPHKLKIPKNCNLIFVSTDLDDVDGLRICVKLKNNIKTAQIPIIIIIDENKDNLLVKAMKDIGVNDYINSSYNDKELLLRTQKQLKYYRYATALEKKIESNLELSIHDKLTKVFNRSHFDDSLSHCIKKFNNQNTSFGIIIMDIDYFKKVNDKYGHVAGDQILQGFSSRINKCLKKESQLFRYGGEEFIILTQGYDLKKLVKLAEYIRKLIEYKGFTIATDKVKGKLKRTASFGVALYKVGDTEKTLLERVDSYLYKSKETGRNKVTYR